MDKYKTQDPIVTFLYQLLRDVVTSGEVERIIQDQGKARGKEYVLSNGFLARYAEDIVGRLRKASEESKCR